jgi:hypothetical protein
MVCRHRPGDPDCGSWRSYTTYTPTTPDAERYEIVDAVQCGNRMVLKVKYPNCANCAYEGTKVLVYDNVTPLDALKWKRIDPHFRADTVKQAVPEAPSPIARFPASEAGWKQAIWFAAQTYNE